MDDWNDPTDVAPRASSLVAMLRTGAVEYTAAPADDCAPAEFARLGLDASRLDGRGPGVTLHRLQFEASIRHDLRAFTRSHPTGNAANDPEAARLRRRATLCAGPLPNGVIGPLERLGLFVWIVSCLSDEHPDLTALVDTYHDGHAGDRAAAAAGLDVDQHADALSWLAGIVTACDDAIEGS